MKRKSVPVIMILLLLFLQCSKDKNEEPAPDLSKGLLAFFELNGNFNDSAKNIQDVLYGGFISNIKNRHGYADRAMYLPVVYFLSRHPGGVAIPSP
jgi:hypothetical protein